MTTSAAPARRVRIEMMSARAELLLVIRVSMAIAIGVWLFLAAQSTAVGTRTGRQNLLPFQKLIADRPPAEQRMFLELQEGLLEAEARRSTNRSWPSVQALAADGIPPFAPDPTRHPSYEWRVSELGTLVNYLGVPTTQGAPAWPIFVQEPEPGAPPDPAREDEEHHLLVGGPMLHVSVWVHPEGQRLAPVPVRVPQAEGWIQLYAANAR